jgi:hypothetical protein
MEMLIAFVLAGAFLAAVVWWRERPRWRDVIVSEHKTAAHAATRITVYGFDAEGNHISETMDLSEAPVMTERAYVAWGVRVHDPPSNRGEVTLAPGVADQPRDCDGGLVRTKVHGLAARRPAEKPIHPVAV